MASDPAAEDDVEEPLLVVEAPSEPLVVAEPPEPPVEEAPPELEPPVLEEEADC